MWIFFSLGAALFAGITSVFAKIGIKNVDSTLATAIRTSIILLFSFIVVLFIKSYNEILNLDIKTIIFLVLSGITTALLWIFYFKALDLGDVNKVSPVDKTSVVLTLILSYIFLNEKITFIKIISMFFLLIGAFLMAGKVKNDNDDKSKKSWLFYAILTAIFTSLATILGKVGLKDIESNLASLIRTVIVFLIIWCVVFIKSKHKEIKNINKKAWLFIVLSGISTGFSWLFYFKALQDGDASSVFPLEKLSIVVAVIGSWIFLKEKMTLKQFIGLFFMVGASLLLIIK